MHVAAAGGQLENGVERGRRAASAPVWRREGKRALLRLLPSCPGDRGHDHQPAIHGAVGGQSQQAGLERGAEGGAGGVKGVFVRDLVGRRGGERGLSRDLETGALGCGYSPLLIRAAKIRVVPAGGGVVLQAWGGGLRVCSSSTWKGKWDGTEGLAAPPPPLSGRECAQAGRVQPLARCSLGARERGERRRRRTLPPAPGYRGPHLERRGGLRAALPTRPGRVACGLFSQLASVALQTRECLW